MKITIKRTVFLHDVDIDVSEQPKTTMVTSAL